MRWRLRGAAHRANIDLETNQWGISPDLSLFHPDTVSSDGEARTERTKRYLFAVAQLSVILTPLPARQVIILMNTCTHARSHTHAHTHARTHAHTPLCLWHFAVWQQQQQARLSSTVNTRQAVHSSCWVTQALSDTCHTKRILQRIRYPGKYCTDSHHALRPHQWMWELWQ